MTLLCKYVVLISLANIAFFNYARADENLLGYVRSAEPLPAGSWEFYEVLTSRSDKGAGRYSALDTETEIEYGATDRLALLGSFSLLSIDTSGILIDAYLPRDEKYSARLSAVEMGVKYNFLSPAKDDLGVTTYLSFEYGWLDKHSGQEKDSYSMELLLLLQKYFLEGQVSWNTNIGSEWTYAKRKDLANLPAGFEWPVIPEIELELKMGTGVSYRVAPNWFLGGELVYETEYETEVGNERWSTFAGPSLHYGSQKWWSTVTWFHQLQGGGESFPEQDDKNLHLVEKTKQEVRLKIGLNF